jgi:hypothetical protein
MMIASAANRENAAFITTPHVISLAGVLSTTQGACSREEGRIFAPPGEGKLATETARGGALAAYPLDVNDLDVNGAVSNMSAEESIQKFAVRRRLAQ